ncbi:MAG: hypothetical protein KGY66_03840 [Candidatus Thermoplasmatota archaeon]|nr:hypothetical protein [Candidatus Thermoplasmatota archaeon]MBS3790029.1 hypothetical protein [Candidatus Thermoplasmatota archaeon]
MKRGTDDKSLKRAINSFLLAQEDPTENLELLQKYLRKKGIADVSTEFLKKEIESQLEKRKEEKRLKKMETRLFKKENKNKKYRYGSAFCGNCSMYKDYQKECPYCGKLEMTR